MANEPLNIEATNDTPLVKQEIAGDSSTIVISGVSMPENTLEFYVPLLEQLKTACAGLSKLELTFHLEYMNSMSNKQVLKLIGILSKEQKNFSVIWKYNKEDELIKMKGEEMSSILEGVSFKVVEA
jgi:hypothetical protein